MLVQRNAFWYLIDEIDFRVTCVVRIFIRFFAGWIIVCTIADTTLVPDSMHAVLSTEVVSRLSTFQMTLMGVVVAYMILFIGDELSNLVTGKESAFIRIVALPTVSVVSGAALSLVYLFRADVSMVWVPLVAVVGAFLGNFFRIVMIAEYQGG